MRIISLLASATEMVAALGCLDQMVGRSHECDYPPEVRLLPVVSAVQIDINTSSAEIDAQVKQLAQKKPEPEDPALKALSIYAIDVDRLQELRPDVIFTQTQCEVCAVSERDVIKAIAQLTGLQPLVVSLSPYRLQDVWEDVLRVGLALGKGEQAQTLVESYQQRLADLASKTAGFGTKPGIAVLEWLDPLMGAGNWTPELVAYAGGENIFGEIGQHSPWLSWEELQSADPDVIVLCPCGYTLERTMQDVPLLQKHHAWADLKAVRNGRVYAIDGNQYLNRSGPRLVESAELLARVIWGERLDIVFDNNAWKQVRAAKNIPMTEEQLRAATIGELVPLAGPVRIVDYDPEWPRLFEREAERVQAALGDKVLLLEHIGSTSVPGLAAKPKIDMLLVVADSADELAYVPDLEAAGYVLQVREPDWYEHRMFKGPDTDVNLHVYTLGCPEIDRELLLRNWLRSNASDRQLYERTKRELARLDWKYMQNYADAKTAVVEEILARALGDAGEEVCEDD